MCFLNCVPWKQSQINFQHTRIEHKDIDGVAYTEYILVVKKQRDAGLMNVTSYILISSKIISHVIIFLNLLVTTVVVENKQSFNIG